MRAAMKTWLLAVAYYDPRGRDFSFENAIERGPNVIDAWRGYYESVEKTRDGSRGRTVLINAWPLTDEQVKAAEEEGWE